MIRNIIFDLGGVILKIDQNNTFLSSDIISTIFKITKQRGYYEFKNMYKILYSEKIAFEKYILRLKKKYKSNLSVSEITKNWRKLYTRNSNRTDKNVLKLINSLKPRYRLFLLTDTNKFNDQCQIKTRRKIYKIFDKVFKSYQEGYVKPDKKAFLNALSKIKSKPEEILFIDDKKNNVKTAIKLGMQGIVYRNMQQLMADLSKIHINPYLH